MDDLAIRDAMNEELLVNGIDSGTGKVGGACIKGACNGGACNKGADGTCSCSRHKVKAGSDIEKHFSANSHYANCQKHLLLLGESSFPPKR